MATPNSFRLRRLSDRATTTKRQLITFTLSQIGFLLPIDSVYRATVSAASDLAQGQVCLEGHWLPVIDLKPLVLGATDAASLLPQAEALEASGASKAKLHRPSATSDIAVLILQRPDGHPSVVIPVDSAPALCRVSEEHLVPLPQAYTMAYVDQMTDRNSEQPLHFLLNPGQLLEKLEQKQSPPPTLVKA